MSKTIMIGEVGYVGNTNVILQQAVDDVAAAGGGVVRVPSGVFVMRDALHLRSKVVVVGEKGAVLKKAESVSSRLKHVVGYGHYEFAVEDATGFEVGMGVHITDDKAGGFYDTTGTIVGRDGDWFYIDRMANHDYSAKSGRVRNVHSVVEMIDVCEAGIEGLTIEGDKHETFNLNGCRGGGVYMLRSQRVYVEAVDVKGFNGDGISFQQCADVAVKDCTLRDNHGQGLHPGSGSVRYLLEDNRIENNGLHGIFYCLRTTHSICRGNVIRGNGDMGITIGERDTDHLVEGNTIEGNGGYGIDFREVWTAGGDRVRVVGNRLSNNCRKEGNCEIHVAGGVRMVEIGGNVIDGKVLEGGGMAIKVGKGCENVWFHSNEIGKRDQEAADAGGKGVKEVMMQPPGEVMDVGPGGAGAEKMMHLGWGDGR